MITHGAQARLRRIPLAGSNNIRDAGGYVTPGGMVQWRRLLRGESLHMLTPAALAEIVEHHGLRAVIDLRTDLERTRHPSPFESSDVVMYLHRPIFRKFRDSLPGSQLESYEFMLTERDNMRDIFSAIANTVDKPILIHCTAGKDRTGVVVALLHDLCGVSEADAVQDYLLTAELLSDEFNDGLRARAASDGVDLHKYEEFLKCVPETLQHVLKQLRDVQGGTEQYLLSVGVTNAEIAAIRQALVKPG